MDSARTWTMSAKELDRLEVLGRVIERRLTQRQAAEQLGLSLRQVERLCRALRVGGAGGLVSRKRGRPSNRKLPEAVREYALDLVRARYVDFGPTLACEKLTEQHGVVVSRETLRRWMIDAGLWVPEYDDGRIELRHAGQLLSSRVFFDKHPHVTQGAIVANKRLGAVLSKIRIDQQERERQRLARRTLTLRQKNQTRAAAAQADAAGTA